MKTIYKSILTAVVAGAPACSALAQNTNSGYFLDNSTYRYAMNPAFGNDANFVSMPALGDLNVATRGNLQLSSVIYKLDGRTVLFTNPGISTSEVMDGIKDVNHLGANIKINVLSAGFKAFNGYNTVSINAVASAGVRVPRAFFSLAKEGVANKTYDISDMRAQGLGYAEIGLGHSHNIAAVPGLRVGATLKFLVGIANVEAYFNDAYLTLGNDTWTATTNADIYANIGGFQYDHKTNGTTGAEYVSGANLDGDGSVGPNGFGMALDLGAEYKWKDFSFSLAVLDMGFINFKDTQHASTNGSRTIDTDAYIFNADGDAPNSFDNEWDRLKGNHDKLYQLTDNGNTGSRSRALHATLNIGVDYALPVYRKLHFGFLSSTRLAGEYTWTEARVSANVHPVKCFSADANVAFGSYGVGFGWLLNFHTTGVNLFLGMDHTLGKITRQFAPLNSNMSVNFGLNFPF